MSKHEGNPKSEYVKQGKSQRMGKSFEQPSSFHRNYAEPRKVTNQPSPKGYGGQEENEGGRASRRVR